MFEEEVEVTLAETGSPFHSSQVRSLLIFKVLESFHNPTICTGCKRTKTNQSNALSTLSGFPAVLPTHLHIFWPNTHLRLVQPANIVRTLRMMVWAFISARPSWQRRPRGVDCSATRTHSDAAQVPVLGQILPWFLQVRCNFIYSCSFPQHHFSQLGFPHRSRSTLT